MARIKQERIDAALESMGREIDHLTSRVDILASAGTGQSKAIRELTASVDHVRKAVLTILKEINSSPGVIEEELYPAGLKLELLTIFNGEIYLAKEAYEWVTDDETLTDNTEEDHTSV
ncbi:hypothetical protein SEA_BRUTONGASTER_73 [Gordonia phage BrutonGaster]|uniref:Uncharacterized protein n=1 Tax=Gordonia phage BrutonGaster TaxID=2530116 RepID=A0A482JMH7_9CAUD|nr:hypothetical protein HOV26_gp109 [Gordonia phage BrutonGaster]QBP33290.1 hypothetical protein SEA_BRUTONGASTER_73 [Gordonia phage BrutonGaster]